MANLSSSTIYAVIKKITFSFIFLSSFSWANLINVTTTYDDGDEKKEVTGTGFWVGLECDDYANDLNGDKYNPEVFNSCKKNLIITAAHLAQGSNTSLSVSTLTNTYAKYSQPIHIVNSYVDNWNDVQILEVSKEDSALDKLQPLLRCKTERIFYDNIIMCHNLFSIQKNFLQHFPNFKSRNTAYYYRNFSYLSSNLSDSIWGILSFLSLVKPQQFDVNTDNSKITEQTDRPYRWTFKNEKVILPNTIIPGMSGSPLLMQSIKYKDSADHFKRYLVGVGIQSDCDFQESIYASHAPIDRLIQNYLSTKHHESLSSPQWYYSNQTYRSLESESFTLTEYDSSKRNTDGTRGDVHDSNKSVCQPGEKRYKTDLFLKENNQSRLLLGFKLEGFVPNTESSSIFGNFFGFSQKDEIPSGAVWADIPSIPHILEINNSPLESLKDRFIVDSKELDLSHLLKSKLEISENQRNQKLNTSNYNQCFVSIIEDKTNFKNTKFIIKINNTNQPGHTLEFKLNANGSIENQFQSRFKIKNSENKSYLVDIRQLFFTDLHEIHSHTEDGFSNPPTLATIVNNDGAKIKIRNLDSNSANDTYTLLCHKNSGGNL